MISNKKDFRILSDKKCVDCGRFIKQNLLDKNPNADQCYKCFKPKVKNQIEVPVECESCDGSGQIVDHSKIHSRSIDVPYKHCEDCKGSGFKNN